MNTALDDFFTTWSTGWYTPRTSRTVSRRSVVGAAAAIPVGKFAGGLPARWQPDDGQPAQGQNSAPPMVSGWPSS
jgi:hypothetical protein